MRNPSLANGPPASVEVDADRRHRAALTPKKGKTVTDEPDKNSEDEFTEMLRQFLSGNSELDPSKLASAAGR
jgi:hypothetical protein